MKVNISKATWEDAGNRMGWFAKSVKISFNEGGFVLMKSNGSELCRVGRDSDSANTVEDVLKALGYKVEIVDEQE